MPFTFGKLAKNLIKLSCITVDATQKSACYIASNFTNSYKTRKSLQKFSNQISDAINDVSVPVSDFAENVIDGSVVLAGDLTGEAAKKVCELCDASPETITAAEKYGKVIGKAAVGFAIGNVAASGLTSALSATGTAGAAATTSGLAALGGSMQTGITAANAITAASTVCAVLTPKDTDCGKLPEPDNYQSIENHSDEGEK